MRILATTFAVLFMAAPALASSIEPFTGPSGASGSVSTVSCAACPALKTKPKSETYHVEAIEPGTQKIEIREENGERKIFRTEAWMGGSPVVFVSKAPAEAAAEAAPVAEERIDADARTGALGTAAAAGASTAAMTVSREFDPSGFALRLN